MDNFENGLNELILNQVKTYFLNQKITIKKLDNYLNKIFFKEWMSIILLAGSQFRIIFKVHYNNSDIICLGKDSLTIAEINSEQTLKDHMKEFTNQLGGSVKRALESGQIQCGLSLPLLTHSFDDLFSVKSEKSHQFFYLLEEKSNEFIVQVYLEYLKTEILNKIDSVNLSHGSESGGGLEFL